MSINKEGNAYTMTFAIIMVVVVGGLLAYIASTLKPIQQANVKNEKMQNILQAIGLEETNGVSRDDAGKIFNDYITKRIILDYDGNVVSELTNEDEIKAGAKKMKDEKDAFNLDVRKYYNTLTGLMKKYPEGGAEYEAALKSEGITYPLFVAENEGKKYYVTYFSGKGLWDDIWGYVAFKEDGSTINGTVFDHKGETPGLGSKITEDLFQNQFKGKIITDENSGEYKPIKVEKPGGDYNKHQVAGLSGATFTAVGVDEMMNRSLAVYNKYFSTLKTASVLPVEIPVSDSITALDSIPVVIDSTLLATK